MSRFVSILRSPRFALAVIAFLTVWIAAGAAVPWPGPSGLPAPAWSAAVGLDHPFTSWPFLAAVALLFAGVLACTWGRRARIQAIARGELPPHATRLPARGADVRAFLASQGFRGEGELLARHRLALWGGWVLHVGLLVLIGAVLLQQALADSGTFDLSEREIARLDAQGTVFARERGPLAREALPPIEVRLEEFQPFLHQPGYSADRRSRLWLAGPGEPGREAELDRAAGVRVSGVEIFQAATTGLAVAIDVPGMGLHAIRLREVAPRQAAATVVDPSGAEARFVVDAERPIDGVEGTGRLLAWIERPGGRQALAPGSSFPFGAGQARAVGIVRWGRFTWSRTPGLWAVFAGFGLILGGCALLVFPAGVARIGRPGDDAAAIVHVLRGADAIAADWNRIEPRG